MLNYHHLRYFRAIATEGTLTGAAQRLRVSQSALSTQLQALEERLGHRLFHREGRGLKLTEAGRIALDYADIIFRAGEELQGTLQGRPPNRSVLRVGAVATLSRNFQAATLRPFIGRQGVELVVRSGTLRELLAELAAQTLDLVLSNVPGPRDAEAAWRSALLDEQPVALVGRPTDAAGPLRFPQDLHGAPLLLPSRQSAVRAAFDLVLDQAGVRPIILAEVDDAAMLRLLAREAPGLTLVPPVVVRDELDSGELVERCRVPELREGFYAITVARRFPNPLLREILK